MKINRRGILRVITLGIICIFVYLIAPKPLYNAALWGDPFDRSVRKFQFSKYVLPTNYEFVSYMQSLGDRKKFILYKNNKTGQQIFIFILTELPKVKFELLDISDKTLKRTLRRYKQNIRGDTSFKLYYLVPQLINKDYSIEYSEATIWGLKTSKKFNESTMKTNIKIVEGEFNQLQFQRKSSNILFKYPVPIFYSNNRMKGALAIINNKENGETIFAFGCNELSKEFNMEEFMQIVRSISFDKEPRALFGTL